MRGKKIPAKIFTILGEEEITQRKEYKLLKTNHEQMLAAYRGQDWSRAKKLIEDCLSIPLAQTIAPLYGVYESRIRAYETTAPPRDWDGVYTAITK